LWRRTTGTVAVWVMDGATLVSMGTLGSPSIDWATWRVEDFSAPTFTNPNPGTLTAGQAGTFFVTTQGVPEPDITRSGVALPTGVTFTDNGNGTASLTGPASTARLLSQITNTTGGSNGNEMPAISGAGTRIVFASDRDLTPGSPGNADGNEELF